MTVFFFSSFLFLLNFILFSLREARGGCKARHGYEGMGTRLGSMLHVKLTKYKKRFLTKRRASWEWWCTSLIPALRKQRQTDLCDFKAILLYNVVSVYSWLLHIEIRSHKTKNQSINQSFNQSINQSEESDTIQEPSYLCFVHLSLFSWFTLCAPHYS